jgi:signal transduction histidine kinase
MKLDRIEFKVEEITLSSIIKEELEDSELGTENKSITIIKQYKDNITFKADRNMFRTVIRNLISNAIKFSHKGGEIIVSAKISSNLFTFSVQDFGVGITQNNLEKLFKIDGGVSTKGTNDEEGTGLGLILCKEFIEKHNGTIKVESEIGKGSTFIVSIPQNL